MSAMKGRILSLIVAVAMVAGGAQTCQGKIDPSTDTGTTAIITGTSVETTTETETETTAAPTSETTTEETTIATETTPETSEPTETTEPTGTAAPTKVPGTPTPTPSIEETPESKVVYAKVNANIRSGPGTSYSIVRTVSAGTALSVVARTANNWYRLEDSTYVSPSVVSDTAPTPTPTPDPNATPTPTPTPTPAGISASQATSIAKSVITSVRSANGLLTNFAPELDAQCKKRALTYTVAHYGYNGTLEAAAAIYEQMGGFWTCTYHYDGPQYFDDIEDCIRGEVRDMIVNHVASMATNAEFTEFGVGIAKTTYPAPWGNRVEYYIYISCTDPEGLAYQIEQGWYD